MTYSELYNKARRSIGNRDGYYPKGDPASGALLPRLGRGALDELYTYWIAEADRVYRQAKSKESGFWSFGPEAAYVKPIKTERDIVEGLLKTASTALALVLVGVAEVPFTLPGAATELQPDAVTIWRRLGSLALRLDASQGQPSRSERNWESVSEAAAELPDRLHDAAAAVASTVGEVAGAVAAGTTSGTVRGIIAGAGILGVLALGIGLAIAAKRVRKAVA